MDLLQKLYFAAAILGLVVLFDVIIKLKRPLLLKLSFVFILVSLIFSAFIFAFDLIQLAYILTPLKAIMTSSFLSVFYLLYFKKLKIWVMIFGIIVIPVSIYAAWFNYTYFDYHLIKQLSGNLGMDTNRSKDVPTFLPIIRVLSALYFNSLILYIWYNIYFHFKEENIYYERIRIWTNFVFVLSLASIFSNLPFDFIRNSYLVSSVVVIFMYFLLLLIILYRPDFLNRASLKIAFGGLFNQIQTEEVSELGFINEFFTKVYYKNPDASLENLAKILNVSSNELYRFVYNNYSMTFNELVNKNRVSYFLDLVKKEAYKNFTIDALAKEVGFSSRQHLYKPFKKFHGGNPSDIIDSMNI